MKKYLLPILPIIVKVSRIMVFPKPPLYLDYLKTEKENLGQQQHHEPTHVQKKKKKRTFINLCSSPNHLPPPPFPAPRPVPIVLGNF